MLLCSVEHKLTSPILFTIIPTHTNTFLNLSRYLFFGPRPGTLHINHNYFTYFFQVTRYCNIYLSRNVTLECLLFERKFSLSTLLFHLQTNSFSLLLTLFSTSFSMFFTAVCVLTMRFFSNSNLIVFLLHPRLFSD